MKKRFLYIVVSAVLLLVLGLNVNAETPYYSYNQTEWKETVAAPDAFKPVSEARGLDIGLENFSEPTDFYMTDGGQLYVLEKSGRISQFNSDLKLITTIDTVHKADGEESPLVEPQGIYVAEGHIYIADFGNSRALRLNADGIIEQSYEKPDDSAYTAEIYQPKKILADSDGMVYVLSEGVYQGAILYTPDGEFVSFYGSAKIQATLKLIADQMWKKILSKEARATMAKYVPVSFTSFDRDSDGFIYTCSSYTNSKKEQIRKLNFLGENIYPFTGNFGESGSVYYKGKTQTTNFVDICAANGGLIYALDDTCGRVYAFDSEGERLLTFGSIGDMTGTFQKAIAVESYKDRVYVLDEQKNSITCFEPTEYGNQILTANALYNDGDYEKALEPWENVLSMNAGYEMAYRGMGEAMMKLGNYKEAVKYFRLGYDRERESKAFALYREQKLKGYTPLILAGLLLVVAALFVLTSKRFLNWRARRKEEKKPKGGILGAFEYVGKVLCHPLAAFEEMKFRRYSNLPFVGIVLIAFWIAEVLARQYTGFRFNTNNPDNLNILVQFFSSAGMFILFAVSNWAICSISSGEGKITEILTFNSYAIIPYILFKAASVPLSMMMSLNESEFLSAVGMIGLLWSAFLLFQSMRIVHQYSSGKTVVTIFLTVCGICIILFLLLLIMSLFLQVDTFFSGVYSEIRFRG